MFREGNRPKRNLFLIIVVILCVLVAALVLLEQARKAGKTDPTYAGKTIWHNGVAYFPRQDIDLFLIMGIDREGHVVDSGSYNNDGAADAVMLVIFNESSHTFDSPSDLCAGWSQDSTLEYVFTFDIIVSCRPHSSPDPLRGPPSPRERGFYRCFRIGECSC